MSQKPGSSHCKDKGAGQCEKSSSPGVMSLPYVRVLKVIGHTQL